MRILRIKSWGKARPEYVQAAQELGYILAGKNIGLVSGGGRVGMMGKKLIGFLDHTANEQFIKPEH